MLWLPPRVLHMQIVLTVLVALSVVYVLFRLLRVEKKLDTSTALGKPRGLSTCACVLSGSQLCHFVFFILVVLNGASESKLGRLPVPTRYQVRTIIRQEAKLVPFPASR